MDGAVRWSELKATHGIRVELERKRRHPLLNDNGHLRIGNKTKSKIPGSVSVSKCPLYPAPCRTAGYVNISCETVAPQIL